MTKLSYFFITIFVLFTSSLGFGTEGEGYTLEELKNFASSLIKQEYRNNKELLKTRLLSMIANTYDNNSYRWRLIIEGKSVSAIPKEKFLEQCQDLIESGELTFETVILYLLKAARSPEEFKVFQFNYEDFKIISHELHRSELISYRTLIIRLRHLLDQPGWSHTSSYDSRKRKLWYNILREIIADQYSSCYLD